LPIATKGSDQIGTIRSRSQEIGFYFLLVWKLRRLAGSLLFSVTMVNALKDRHAIVPRSVTEPSTPQRPMGGMIFAILASFAAEEPAGNHEPNARRQKREGEPRRIRGRCSSSAIWEEPPRRIDG